MISKVKYVNYILLGLGVVFTILFFFAQSFGFEEYDVRVLNLGLDYMYVQGFIAIGLVLGFVIYNYVQNPQSIKPTLIVLIAAAVVIGIGLIFSSSEVIPNLKNIGNTAANVKLAGVNLLVIYILFFVALLGILVTEIVNALK